MDESFQRAEQIEPKNQSEQHGYPDAFDERFIVSDRATAAEGTAVAEARRSRLRFKCSSRLNEGEGRTTATLAG